MSTEPEKLARDDAALLERAHKARQAQPRSDVLAMADLYYVEVSPAALTNVVMDLCGEVSVVRGLLGGLRSSQVTELLNGGRQIAFARNAPLLLLQLDVHPRLRLDPPRPAIFEKWPGSQAFSDFLTSRRLPVSVVARALRMSRRTVNNWREGLQSPPNILWTTLLLLTDSHPSSKIVPLEASD